MLTERLDGQLLALQHAQDSGAVARAMELRATIVAERLVEGALEHGQSEQLDVVLLDRLAADLQRVALHAAALDVLAVARTAATRRADSLWKARIELHAVRSCIGLLDFAAAEQVLRRCLSISRDVTLTDDSALTSALTLSPTSATSRDLHDLRVEALGALGSFQISVGWFGAGVRSLRAALRMMEEQACPWLSTADTALLIGETLLDRGELDEFDRFADSQAAKQRSAAHAVSWELLQASAYRLRGRLSHAERQFASAARSAGSARPLVARMARWQRVQVLATLNRMDEAEAECTRLGQDGVASLDVASMRRILAARRGAASIQLDTGLAPSELLSEHADPDWLPTIAEAEPAAAAYRTQENIRGDWSRIGWAILLDAHAGRIAAAVERLGILTEWLPSIDSRAFEARYARLAAIVAYYSRDFVAARRSIERAYEIYDDVGMRTDACDVSRLRVWILRASGAPQLEIDDEVKRYRVVIAAITTDMDSADALLFQLNKWSTIDDAVALWFRELRQAPARSSASYAALRRALTVKRWVWEKRTAGHEDADVVRAGPADVFRLAQEQARQGARRGRRLRRAVPLHPRLVPRGTAVLSYISLPDSLELFLVQEGRCELLARRDASTRVNLHGEVQRVIALLARGGSWLELRDQLESLANLVGLADVATRLKPGVRRLIIVPDDGVEHVPFAALPLNGAPLVARLTPIIAPAADWRQRKRWEGRASRPLAVDVLSDAASAGQGHEVGAELRGLASLSVSIPQLLAGAEATVFAVRGALGTADVAHLACHGRYDAENPLLSGLGLSDGLLTVRDIQALSLPRARLIVMGACWAANSATLPGREMIGLPTALLAAGTSNVVAALWELFDSVAPDDSKHTGSPVADFMSELYTELRTAAPSEALAAVQRRWASHRPVSDWTGYQAYADGVELGPFVSRLLSLVGGLG